MLEIVDVTEVIGKNNSCYPSDDCSPDDYSIGRDSCSPDDSCSPNYSSCSPDSWGG